MAISLIFDIIITFNRSLISNGIRIVDHKVILDRYLRGYFFLDLVIFKIIIIFFIIDSFFFNRDSSIFQLLFMA